MIGLARTISFEEVFSTPDYLKVLYFLARENPRITTAVIAKGLKMQEDLADTILNSITFLHMAVKEGKKGYTLTDEGLAMLFNFHKNFAKPAN